MQLFAVLSAIKSYTSECRKVVPVANLARRREEQAEKKKFIGSLNDNQVRYLVIGGYDVSDENVALPHRNAFWVRAHTRLPGSQTAQAVESGQASQGPVLSPLGTG
jgi:hypothetical protein